MVFGMGHDVGTIDGASDGAKDGKSEGAALETSSCAYIDLVNAIVTSTATIFFTIARSPFCDLFFGEVEVFVHFNDVVKETLMLTC